MNTSVSFTTANRLIRRRQTKNRIWGVFSKVNKTEISPEAITVPRVGADMNSIEASSEETNEATTQNAIAPSALTDTHGMVNFSLFDKIEIYKNRIIMPPRKIKTKAFIIHKEML